MPDETPAPKPAEIQAKIIVQEEVETLSEDELAALGNSKMINSSPPINYAAMLADLDSVNQEARALLRY